MTQTTPLPGTTPFNTDPNQVENHELGEGLTFHYEISPNINTSEALSRLQDQGEGPYITRLSGIAIEAQDLRGLDYPEASNIITIQFSQDLLSGRDDSDKPLMRMQFDGSIATISITNPEAVSVLLLSLKQDPQILLQNPELLKLITDPRLISCFEEISGYSHYSPTESEYLRAEITQRTSCLPEGSDLDTLLAELQIAEDRSHGGLLQVPSNLWPKNIFIPDPIRSQRFPGFIIYRTQPAPKGLRIGSLIEGICFSEENEQMVITFIDYFSPYTVSNLVSEIGNDPSSNRVFPRITEFVRTLL